MGEKNQTPKQPAHLWATATLDGAARGRGGARPRSVEGERLVAGKPGNPGGVRALVHARHAGAERPHARQVNDMYGFPKELYAIEYRPPGNAELTRRVLDLLGDDVQVDDTWGIDHGVNAASPHAAPGQRARGRADVNGLADALRL